MEIVEETTNNENAPRQTPRSRTSWTWWGKCVGGLFVAFAVGIATLVRARSGTTDVVATVRGGATRSNDRSSSSSSSSLSRRLERTRTGGAAIAVLVPSIEEDVENCCVALRSLRFLQGDRDRLPWDKAPVLLFNEGDLSKEQMTRLERCTDRTVAFPIARLKEAYPDGFGDATEEWASFLETHRVSGVGTRPGRFGYAHMISFWTRWAWEHPAVQQFDTIMRVDTDSCFLESIADNPTMNRLPYLDDRYVYHSIAPLDGMGRHYWNRTTGLWSTKQHKKSIPDIAKNFNCAWRNRLDYITGLYDYLLDYMKREDITPVNEGIWGATTSGWEQFCSLQTFQSNFEVVRRDFFLSPKVLRWHRALVGTEPFGTYRFRWGDAETRFLTMGMFAPEGSVLSSPIDGYAHGKEWNGDEHPFKCREADREGMFDSFAE